ncbi:M23 family metallopeptidase [bacterium]|nr:M23 family metallopeptidase [bacterium]
MLFTIKRPKSRRFFQLSFEGFRPSGRNKIDQFKNTWIEFAKVLGLYLVHRFKTLCRVVWGLVRGLFHLPIFLKAYLTKKLIWSRGRLGRPIATATVLGVSFFVFFVGEILSGSSFVVAKEVDSDYLTRSSDIMPSRNIATTTVPDERKRAESFEYAVQSGDTISGIGEKFRISADALKYVNGLTDTAVLKVGRELTIPPISGLIHEVEDGDTLGSIAEKYDVAPQAIADFNYILDTSKLAIGSELVIPGAKVPQPVAPPVYISPTPGSTGYYAQATPSKNFCVWPTTVRIITQYFTWYHNGVDISTPRGGGMPPLFSCTSGTVVRAGWNPWGLGLHVRIDHGNGYQTVYGHMSRIDVGYGQRVSRGQVIGLMGNTGRSTGAHVHFMVQYNGVAQNPFDYVN